MVTRQHLLRVYRAFLQSAPRPFAEAVASVRRRLQMRLSDSQKPVDSFRPLAARGVVAERWRNAPVSPAES
jgi:hypothetical protein